MTSPNPKQIATQRAIARIEGVLGRIGIQIEEDSRSDMLRFSVPSKAHFQPHRISTMRNIHHKYQYYSLFWWINLMFANGKIRKLTGSQQSQIANNLSNCPYEPSDYPRSTPKRIDLPSYFVGP